MMDEKLDMRKQYALEAQKATCILGCTNRGVAAGIGRRLPPSALPSWGPTWSTVSEPGTPIQEGHGAV